MPIIKRISIDFKNGSQDISTRLNLFLNGLKSDPFLLNTCLLYVHYLNHIDTEIVLGIRCY